MKPNGDITAVHASGRIRHVRKILIIKPSSMGDVVHTFKAVQLLAENYPKAVFDWVINPEFSKLLDYAPVTVGSRIHFRRKELGKFRSFVPESISLLRNLRASRYDLVVDFQGLLRSGVLTFLSRHTHTVGFASPRESAAARWYRRKVEISETCLHAVDRNVELAGYYCDLKNLSKPLMIPHNEDNRKKMTRKLAKYGVDLSKKIVAVFPGARWESKTFPPALFATLINDISTKYPEMIFLLLGSISENPATIAVAKLTKNKVFNLAGSTGIDDMVEIIRQSALVISNDSGPLHVAAMLETPSISFFGSTDPERTGPYGTNIKVFQREIPCKNCMKRKCDTASEYCFKLPYEDILEAAETFLNNPLSISCQTTKPER